MHKVVACRFCFLFSPAKSFRPSVLKSIGLMPSQVECMSLCEIICVQHGMTLSGVKHGLGDKQERQRQRDLFVSLRQSKKRIISLIGEGDECSNGR